MITINQNKCIGCGQCIKVCPFTVLKMNDEKKAECTEKACIKCMHCAAICPVNAITYNNQKAVEEAVEKLPQDFDSQLEILLKQRRSYRRFKEEKVKREKILHWLDVANLVPSAKNQHPTNWIVIDDESITNQIMQSILVYCEKEHVTPEILTEYQNGNNPVLGEHASVLIGYCFGDAIHAVTDTSIAITTVELMMQAEQVGTCWGGYLTHFLNTIPECKALIGLPEGAVVCGTLLYGYPKQSEYRYVPMRMNKAKVNFNGKN